MKRVAAILALVVGSQGCVGFLKKDPDGYYTNESVVAAMAIPAVIAVGVGLLVYAGSKDEDPTLAPQDMAGTTLPPSTFPEEH